MALEQLQQKQMLLKELDLKIANRIMEAEELEQEICDTQDQHSALAEKIAYVHEFLSCPSHPIDSTEPSQSPPPSVTMPQVPGASEVTSEADTSITETLPEEVDTHTETLVDPTSAETHTTTDRTIHVSPPVNVSDSIHRTTRDTFHQNTSRLPKLNLPFLNQARGGRRPACVPGFLKSLYVCVCVSAPEAMND